MSRRLADCHTDNFTIKHRTDAALHVTHLETGEVMWLPKSQIEEIHEQPNGSVKITMTKWIAQKKGLL